MSTCREALDRARRHGLATEFAAAAMGFADAEQIVYLPSREGIGLLEEALRAVGPDEAVLKCRLLGRLGRAFILVGEEDRAAMITGEARIMAERLGDQRSLADILANELMSVSPPSTAEFDRRRHLIRQYCQLSEAQGDVFDESYAAPLVGFRFLEIG